jgi:enoyl-[acyl-carrier-protein] reductase (NADH)
MRRFLKLQTYVGAHIHFHVCVQNAEEIPSYNKMTKKNWKMLARLIKAIYFLAKQELSFRGQDGSVKSLSKGNYAEVLQCSAECNCLLST